MASPRSRRLFLALLAVGVVAAPAGWFGTDALERDNDFCNACHLEPGVPLHTDIRDDFDARPVMSLAGLHAAAPHPDRPADEPFRCIDCHGGASFVGKTRTKLLAAKDGMWWLLGHFDEPTEMAWPLWDEDCRQCHADFQTSGGTPENPPFHSLDVHNTALGVACVECHQSHETRGREELYYLRPAHVREQCARCHTQFE